MRLQNRHRAVAGLAGKPHVLEDGQAAEEVGDLERPRQAEPRPAMRGHPRDVLAEELDAAAGRAQLARDEAEERGLAGAVGPDDRDPLARRPRVSETPSTAVTPPKRRPSPSGRERAGPRRSSSGYCWPV